MVSTFDVLFYSCSVLLIHQHNPEPFWMLYLKRTGTYPISPSLCKSLFQLIQHYASETCWMLPYSNRERERSGVSAPSHMRPFDETAATRVILSIEYPPCLGNNRLDSRHGQLLSPTLLSLSLSLSLSLEEGRLSL